MATRQPFWMWHIWKSISQWQQTTYIWNLKLKFQSKVELCSSNQAKYRVHIPKIQYGCQAAILKVTLLKINRLLSIQTSDMQVKFGLDIESLSKIRIWKLKIQYGCQAAILTVTSLKINVFLPIATKNMHMKFEIEISKQTWVMLQQTSQIRSPYTKNPIWLPGGRFESDMAENQ